MNQIELSIVTSLQGQVDRLTVETARLRGEVAEANRQTEASMRAHGRVSNLLEGLAADLARVTADVAELTIQRDEFASLATAQAAQMTNAAAERGRLRAEMNAGDNCPLVAIADILLLTQAAQAVVAQHEAEMKHGRATAEMIRLRNVLEAIAACAPPASGEDVKP